MTMGGLDLARGKSEEMVCMLLPLSLGICVRHFPLASSKAVWTETFVNQWSGMYGLSVKSQTTGFAKHNVKESLDTCEALISVMEKARDVKDTSG